jgi:membrane protein YqaA with SNARE-associated domain
MKDSLPTVEITKESSGKRQYLISGIALSITLALCITAVIYSSRLKEFEQYGYLGTFVINIFAGGTVVVPVPGVPVVFTLGGVLNPAIVGALAGIGEAIGSAVIYMIGYGGHKSFKRINHRFVKRFEGWMDRRGSLTVFLMSAIVNPLFYPFALTAGMLHFGLIKFFLLCWVGKTVKGMTIAYLGYYGLSVLLRWIGK